MDTHKHRSQEEVAIKK